MDVIVATTGKRQARAGNVRNDRCYHGQMPNFIADDKFFDVIRVLRARGWLRLDAAVDDEAAVVASSSETVDLRWRNLSNTPFAKVQPGSLVNHLEGSQCLSNKGKLTRLLAAANGGLGSASYPRCHALASGSAAAASSRPSLREEAALTLALEELLRDMGTQLAVGALRTLFNEVSGPTAGQAGEVMVDSNLFVTCITIAERWAEQLELSLGDSSGGRRVPSRRVLGVGSAAWDLLLASGGSVQSVATRLRQPTDGVNGDTSVVLATVIAPRVDEVLQRLAVLDTHFSLGAGGVWIIKPSGQSCGRGIVCKDSVVEVAEAVAALEFKAVVQKYGFKCCF